MLACLREINLWGSENLKEIPDLSMATKLEKLYLGYCLSWVALPSSIRTFNELTELGMLECRNLATLPTDINLESPKSLSLTERSQVWLRNLFDFRMGNIKGEKLRQGMQVCNSKINVFSTSFNNASIRNYYGLVEFDKCCVSLFRG